MSVCVGSRSSPGALNRTRRLALATLVLILLSGCEEAANRFVMVSSESVNDTPYLLVETSSGLFAHPDQASFFNIYRCQREDGSAWEAIVKNRQGPVFGTFVYAGSGSEVLGTFHPGRVGMFRFTEEGVKSEFSTLDFEWIPETGAQLGDALFIFGGDFKKTPTANPGRRTGSVAVARYDGKTFKELNIGNMPTLEEGLLGFWIKSVYHQGKIHLFWRSAEGLGSADMEPPISLTGPLKRATFDGRAFQVQESDVEGFPHGFMDIWSDGNRLRAIVQPQDPTFGKTARLRLFTITDEGMLEEEVLSKPKTPLRLRIKHYNVVRVPSGESDVFLRTNSQAFELWWPGPDGWHVGMHPKGLPRNNWESFLFSLFALCVLVVAGGLGLAYRRRQQVRVLMRKLRPNDVMAPLSLRISAHLVDLFILCVGTEVFSRILGVPNAGIVRNLFDFTVPRPYFALYLLYLGIFEWSFGATLGKLALGLRVVTSKGERPTIWSAMVRNLIGFYERHIMLAGFAALPTILLTPRHQRLGDLLARTVVVQKTAMDRFCVERAEKEDAAMGITTNAEESEKDPLAAQKDDNEK